MAVTVHEIAPNTWLFDENGGVNLYLIAGKKYAVLLDTGFDGSWLPDKVRELTELPVTMVHTHYHGDHTGGDRLWSPIWIHESEVGELLSQPGHEDLDVHPLHEGEVIDLGGRHLKIIHIPGHSPGSIALLDVENRMLFSGDTVMTQPVFLHNPDSDVHDFLASLDKLASISDSFDVIYPSHASWPLGIEQLAYLRKCALDALSGKEPVNIDIDLETPEGLMSLHFEGYKSGNCGVITAEKPKT